MTTNATADISERIASVFRKFDSDDAGLISQDDLSACFVKLGMPAERLPELLDKYCIAKDGRINYHLFIKSLYAPKMTSVLADILDHLDDVEDMAALSLSRISSGDEFPEEVTIDADGETDLQEKALPSSSNSTANAHDGADHARVAILKRLEETPYLPHSHRLFMHGRAYDGTVAAPKKTWACDKPPRDDHAAPNWLTASEFQDTPAVTAAKVQQLAAMMRLSAKTVAYTGAGISASVVGQAARSGTNTQGWVAKQLARPTFTHFALGFLGRQGLIHSWVQQNHDGLPQKAGFPQECINEIHGSWFDPSNPVVKYSGSLHSRAFPWMEEDAETADLVIVLGTSLGGLNADQVPICAADRSQVGASLGSVIINLQQTEQDGKMTLRCFAKSDDLLRLLIEQLGFDVLRCRAPTWSAESCILVPYDTQGHRLRDGRGRRMWLDLRDGQRVKLAADHNIQGAKQPQFMHIGASKPVSYKGQTREPGIGRGSVTRRDEESCSFLLQIEGVQMRLGIWWLEAAARGGPAALPVINEAPIFEDEVPRGFHEPKAKAKAASKAQAKAKPKARSRSPSRPSRPS